MRPSAEGGHGVVGHGVVGHGVVTGFDVAVGLGTVRTDDGLELGFHCTQIADGSRHIAVGAPVGFVVIAGRHGRWEAGVLRPAPFRPDTTTVAANL